MVAQLTRAREYIDCISTQSKESLGYDTEKSDGEAPLMLDRWGKQNII